VLKRIEIEVWLHRYKDASKTTFKSSTRLECMMQDYPRTLSPSAKVGFSVGSIPEEARLMDMNVVLRCGFAVTAYVCSGLF
jgi:hypothetical protein